MILALVIGTGFGCISGFLVTKGRLQPFIATLITMTVFRGLTMIYMDGKPISNLGDSFTLKVVGKGNFYHIPIPVILFLLIFVIFLFVLQKTTFGRHIYATGSNAKAANLAGVNIDRTKLAVALGGTSMNGGRGKIWGTFIGVLIIAVLNNGLNILGVSSYYQDVVKGIVILIAVLSDRRR